MTLRIGRYNFPYVVYDAASDVAYANLGPGSRGDDERIVSNPEGDRWIYDGAGRFSGLTLIEPAARLGRDGAVWTSLPSGEYSRVGGLDATIRAADADYQ